jgi:hypothetical protein
LKIETSAKGERLGQYDTNVGHELLAGRADFLRKGGAEHHDLLVVRRCPEDLLDVAAHV